MLKKIIGIMVLTCLVLSAPTFAEEMSAEQILAVTDPIRGGGYDGVEWKLKITATDSNIDNNVRELHVKVLGSNSLAETTYPPRAAGGRLLQVERNMWYGRPDLSKPISISSRQKILGPAANGDIASTNYSQDYNAKLVRIEMVNGEPAYLLDLTGKTKWVTYDRIEYWVSQKRLIPLKAAFYTVSGKLFKTADFEINNSIMVKGKTQPFVSRMTIHDTVNSNNVSVLDYSQVKVNTFGRNEFSVEGFMR